MMLSHSYENNVRAEQQIKVHNLGNNINNVVLFSDFSQHFWWIVYKQFSR